MTRQVEASRPATVKKPQGSGCKPGETMKKNVEEKNQERGSSKLVKLKINAKEA